MLTTCLDKWMVDEDSTYLYPSWKSRAEYTPSELTFIIHARDPASYLPLSQEALLGLPMVGDVNFFLKGSLHDEDFEVEVEIMIAGSSSRGLNNPAHSHLDAQNRRIEGRDMRERLYISCSRMLQQSRPHPAASKNSGGGNHHFLSQENVLSSASALPTPPASLSLSPSAFGSPSESKSSTKWRCGSQTPPQTGLTGGAGRLKSLYFRNP
jgi:hypothetical protein